MKLIERIRWIKEHAKVKKLVVSDEEFDQVAEAIERKERLIGTEHRYMIIAPDGRVAVEDNGTIYLSKFNEFYLTSRFKVYKESKAAYKAIEKHEHVLKGCSVKPVRIVYEVEG